MLTRPAERRALDRLELLLDQVKAVEAARDMHLTAEPRLSATVIQTVGSKGYDGFALARVIADP